MSEEKILSPLENIKQPILKVDYKYRKGKIDSCSYQILKNVQNLNSAYNYIYPYNSKADNSKHAFLDSISRRFSEENDYNALLNAELKRKKVCLKNFKSKGYYTKEIKLKTDSRVVIGLGEGSSLEVGMTFHHIYGYPVIPSTALKGVTRAWLELAVESNEKDQISSDLFGSSLTNNGQNSEMNKLGGVTFLDGTPIQMPKLEVDIMNPHYSDYYSNPKKNPPADWYSPSPIFFLTIAPKQEFWFGLISEDQELLEMAEDYLINGLSELGIGAKTSSGYGYFLSKKDELARINRKKEKIEAQRPDWAKEKEKKIENEVEEFVQSNDLDKVQHLIEEGDYHAAYEIWNEIKDEKIKKEAAELFYSGKEHVKYMEKKTIKKKKFRKDWAIAIMNYLKN